MSASKNLVLLKGKALPLIRYDAMCAAIAACHDIDEVMQYRAEAAVMAEAYAKIANDPDQVNKCEQIQRRAERRAAEKLAELEKNPGGRPTGNPPQKVGGSSQRTLKDMGISTQQASDWKALAKVPEPEFEKAITKGKVPSARDIVAQHKATRHPKAPIIDKVDPMALWLWGHLTEFERQGVLSMNPNVLIKTMLDHMKKSTTELAPRVAAWLGKIKT